MSHKFPDRNEQSVTKKKGSPLFILKILEEYSDENHFLTYKQIGNLLLRDYDINLERKAIANSIQILIEAKYDINQSPNRQGWALFSRLLNKNEVRYLIDGVYSSKSISSSQAKQLMGKINSTQSIYERENSRYAKLYKTDEVTRIDNKEVFFNIEILTEAINKNKMVEFKYYTFDKKGNLMLPEVSKYYKVNPYFLVNNFGKYYLLANYTSYTETTTFRVEFICDIKILEYNRKDISLIPEFNYDKFSIGDYLSKHIYLFGGETVNAKLEIIKDSPTIRRYIFDWFGSNAKVVYEEGIAYAEVLCNRNALLYWCLQYGSYVRIVEPSDFLDQFKKTLERINKLYK